MFDVHSIKTSENTFDSTFFYFLFALFLFRTVWLQNRNWFSIKCRVFSIFTCGIITWHFRHKKKKPVWLTFLFSPIQNFQFSIKHFKWKWWRKCLNIFQGIKTFFILYPLGKGKKLSEINEWINIVNQVEWNLINKIKYEARAFYFAVKQRWNISQNVFSFK